jgi:hypothetical protein
VILGNLRSVIIYGPDGKVVSSLRTYDVKLERLYRVIRRITCGLFFHLLGYRLDSSYGVGVLGDEQLTDLDRAIREQFIGYLKDSKKVVIGDDVFSFQGFRSATDRMLTGWRYLFYGKVEFIAATLPLGFIAGNESETDRPSSASG